MPNIQMLCCHIFRFNTSRTLVLCEPNPQPEFPDIPQTSAISSDDCGKLAEGVAIKNKTPKCASLKEELPIPAH